MSSTASFPVSFSRSSTGFTSTTSIDERESRLRDELHGEVRLAVGEPAAHRRPDARCHVGIDRVHVEAHVNEARAGHVGERLANRMLDSETIHVAHREHLRVELAQQLPLAVVQRTDSHKGDPTRFERGQAPAIATEAIAGEAERRREHHAVHVAARARVRAVQIAVRVDPDHAARPVHARAGPTGFPG